MNFKILLIGVLLICSFSIFSQKCDYRGNDTLKSALDSIVSIPLKNIMYRDYGFPFLVWKEKPKSVLFTLYNRWGEVYDQSENPDFIVDADNIKKVRLHEDEVLMYRIKITRNSGEIIFICGQLTYVGYWRCG